MSYCVTKQFAFDAAHRLMRHQGKCHNIHGHRYVVEVTIERGMAMALSADGMVLDFGDLKPFKEWLDKDFDHALVLESTDPIVGLLAAGSVPGGLKICLMNAAPTAEAMANLFTNKLQSMLRDISPDSTLSVVCVRVYETPTSYAEFRPEVG